MTDPFVTRDLALYAAEVDPARFRQWLVRQWSRGEKRPRDTWTIAIACDVLTHEVVYSLPDVMRAAAATRRSPMRRSA